MNQIKVPGVVYSLILAIGAWAIDYLTGGDGSTIPWAPIALAAIPIILKAFTVQAPTPVPVSTSRSLSAVPEQPSKTREFLLG